MSKETCFACTAEGQSKCNSCGNSYCGRHGSEGLCSNCQQKILPYREENAEQQARTRLSRSIKQKK